jgi:hypothetical protein
MNKTLGIQSDLPLYLAFLPTMQVFVEQWLGVNKGCVVNGKTYPVKLLQELYYMEVDVMEKNHFVC